MFSLKKSTANLSASLKSIITILNTHKNELPEPVKAGLMKVCDGDICELDVEYFTFIGMIPAIVTADGITYHSVTSINAFNKVLTLTDGNRMPFDKCVVTNTDTGKTWEC